MTCSNKLSQRFGIFDLVDLVEKNDIYEWKTTIMDILSIFFFFFVLASQEEPLRVHVRASNDKLSSERQCSGPPERIGT